MADSAVTAADTLEATAPLHTIATAERDKLRLGTRVRSTGAVARMSMCQQGTTISAAKIEILK